MTESQAKHVQGLTRAPDRLWGTRPSGSNQGADFILQLQTLLAHFFLRGFRNRLNAGFRAVNLTIDLMILIREPGKVRIGLLELGDSRLLAWKLFSKFVWCVTHINLHIVHIKIMAFYDIAIGQKRARSRFLSRRLNRAEE